MQNAVKSSSPRINVPEGGALSMQSGGRHRQGPALCMVWAPPLPPGVGSGPHRGVGWCGLLGTCLCCVPVLSPSPTQRPSHGEALIGSGGRAKGGKFPLQQISPWGQGSLMNLISGASDPGPAPQYCLWGWWRSPWGPPQAVGCQCARTGLPPLLWGSHRWEGPSGAIAGWNL